MAEPQELPQQWPPVGGPPSDEPAGPVPPNPYQPLGPLPPLAVEQSPGEIASHGVKIDQYLNQLHVDFDYDVVAGGPYGLARVELWCTSDHGREWTRIALDNDNRSPIRGNFPTPGVYGLRIVVEPTGGLEAMRPRPGDKPEMYIAIDTQAPQARLTRVRQGEGYFADHLMVSWETSDENLQENAAVLYYSANRDGPWQTVATNLTNSGQFAWRLARHVPSEFYLRLETVDLAGNKASDQTAVPVKIVLPTASGQLQHARPAGQ